MTRALPFAPLVGPVKAAVMPIVALVTALITVFTAAAPVAAQDSRLVERFYDPNAIVRVEGKTKVQATIAFGETERIENVAIGDSEAWQVTPNKRANVLFVKPLTPSARTNMTVITNRHTYLFDLVASPSARPIYVLRFLYPDEPEEEVEEPLAAGGPNALKANALELAAANDPYAVVDPAALNFAWKREGNRDLMPVRIYDDGNATFLSWEIGKPVPAILVKDAAGAEGPVNFSVREDIIVVDGVPPVIILRAGKEVAMLTNVGPVREPAKPQAMPESYGPGSEFSNNGKGK